jgi:hypothetical protein
VDVVLSDREFASQHSSGLKEIVVGCSKVLMRLEETLEKYWELDSNPKSFGKKSQRVWKRLKWEPEDIGELRSRITTHISSLNAFLGRITK